ncbi:S-adenosyl-L-methionine-dependent methyltransferase [Russula emetica]|nr:S-adenosyl-L-methionine-dependent methyltransferase [Russula emetica]
MNPHRICFIRQNVLEVLQTQPDATTTATANTSFSSNPTQSLESPRVMEGMDVLDVGCGGGILSESLARLGANTLAIDASAENIGIATRHVAADPSFTRDAASASASGTLAFQHATAEALVQEPKRFNIVCSNEVVEHVDSLAGLLRSCAELVKPGGHLFLSTMARTPLSYLLSIVAAEKPLTPGSLPWVSRTYAHGLPTLLETEVRGMVYVPWRGDWVMAPRATSRRPPWSTQANYLFWVRKPKDQCAKAFTYTKRVLRLVESALFKFVNCEQLVDFFTTLGRNKLIHAHTYLLTFGDLTHMVPLVYFIYMTWLLVRLLQILR